MCNGSCTSEQYMHAIGQPDSITCCQPIFTPAQECGHLRTQDDELFDHRLSSQAAPSLPQRVMLAYDQRMTLHAEGKLTPHPERPDRIRAVMARLAASGLTGLALLTTFCCLLSPITIISSSAFCASTCAAGAQWQPRLDVLSLVPQHSTSMMLP